MISPGDDSHFCSCFEMNFDVTSQFISFSVKATYVLTVDCLQHKLKVFTVCSQLFKYLLFMAEISKEKIHKTNKKKAQDE